MGEIVQTIAEAIARQEGFHVHGSLAQRQNNPGNLRSWGLVTISNGYADFPTLDDGWMALRRQVELNISRGLTLEEFFCGKPGVYAGYSPNADGNNCKQYGVNVAGWTGLPVSIPLNRFSEQAGIQTANGSIHVLLIGGTLLSLLWHGKR